MDLDLKQILSTRRINNLKNRGSHLYKEYAPGQAAK